MKKKILTFLIVLLLSLALAVPALASPPSPAAGTFVLTGVSPDGTIITFQLFGTFDGTFELTLSPGRANKGVFTGSIGGGDAGTIMFNSLDATENNPGHFTSLRGSSTGGLVGAHAVGTFTFDEDTGIGSYVGQYHYDPPN